MPQHGSRGPSDPGATIAELGEAGLLTRVFARLGAPSEAVLVGPGDDTAYLRVSGGAVLATTDTMVRGRDWRDEWSGAGDVGAKLVVQNLADLAAMGGVGTALLVTLVAPGDLPAAWATEFTEGVAEQAGVWAVPVVGGDLSSSGGEVMVSVTALGGLPGPGPVLRSGARAGQVLALSGPLGRSGAGLELLRRGDAGWWPGPAVADRAGGYVAYHCRPAPDLSQGPLAAAAGASAMIDVSDGLGRDATRVATASGVRIDLDPGAVAGLVAPIAEVLEARSALECVLTGGEEHELLATFEPADVPAGWVVVGAVSASAGSVEPGVWWRGERLTGGGWDHFGG